MKRKRDFFEITYTDLSYRLALHVAFWLAMGSSYYYFNTISFTPAGGTPAAFWLAAKNTVEYAFAFYVLMYWIWPRFIRKRKWFKALALLFVWLLAVTALDAWLDQRILAAVESYAVRMKRNYADYYNFLQHNFSNIVLVRVVTGGLLYHLLMQLSFPIAIKIGRSHFRQTVEGLRLSKDNLQLEFNFLKSQVNPHFLFNTLNNIYSLVVAERKDQAAATLARLSGFMRYALYETGGEAVALDKEMQLLRDYIELEKLRMNDAEVVFTCESDNRDYKVPPLLLMPAVENAFKHCNDKEGSRIVVGIKAAKGELSVAIQNNFDPQRRQKTGGIGLQNLQRRLRHYFGDKAVYAATATNDVYLLRVSCPLT